MNAETIGQRIKACRKALKLTQTRLGELAGGYSTTYICDLERGRTPLMPVKTLMGLAEALGTTVGALLGEVTEKPPQGGLDASGTYLHDERDLLLPLRDDYPQTVQVAFDLLVGSLKGRYEIIGVTVRREEAV